MKFVLDLKAVAGITLIVCSLGFLLFLPARMRRERAKLDRFDPDLHSGEILATEPIGQEFGAKFK